MCVMCVMCCVMCVVFVRDMLKYLNSSKYFNTFYLGYYDITILYYYISALNYK
jgi:hypothetical protein